MRNLSELNINERGKPTTRAAPSDNIVEAFEMHFGVKLPKEYLDLLRHANGGHPELDCFEPIGRSGALRWAVNRFYYLDEDKVSPSSLWKATHVWQPVLGTKTIPFASDGGGNQFFLDFQTTSPGVKVSVHDEGFRAIDLAPSFEVFIDGLEVDPDSPTIVRYAVRRQGPSREYIGPSLRAIHLDDGPLR